MISYVHEHDPVRVPHAPPRFARPEDWYTLDEARLANTIGDVQRQMSELHARKAALLSELAEVTTAADVSDRLLLTEDGNALVEIVERVLTELGFTVLNMDRQIVHGEPKREDLRVSDVDHPAWACMAEVKGYGRGGVKTNDARQINQHRRRYHIEEARDPDSVWWIVNPHRGSDPSTRAALSVHEVEAATNIDSVMIPTTDLYRLWQAVCAGRRRRPMLARCSALRNRVGPGRSRHKPPRPTLARTPQ